MGISFVEDFCTVVLAYGDENVLPRGAFGGDLDFGSGVILV